MLTIFNTNELRRAVEVAKLQGDIQYILENSPAAQELIKHIRRQELVSGYSCIIGGAEWCKLDFNALPCCLTTSSVRVATPLFPSILAEMTKRNANSTLWSTLPSKCGDATCRYKTLWVHLNATVLLHFLTCEEVQKNAWQSCQRYSRVTHVGSLLNRVCFWLFVGFLRTGLIKALGFIMWCLCHQSQEAESWLASKARGRAEKPYT